MLAFIQRPGDVVFDSRIELSTDVGLFLDRITEAWSPTVDLGHVQSGQFVGYLFPMGPWYAAWDATGLPLWIGQRVWLGMLLWAAACGAARLVQELFGRTDLICRIAAGCFYGATPYVVTFASGSSITLLAYAGLPWLMLAAHRGALTPRGWRWPAAAGLLVGFSVGGVNFAVLVWVVLGALALLAYEVLALDRPARAAAAFLWRAALCTSLASMWWAIPVAIQAGYGEDFLRFTEGPETIWATTSMSESIRGLGYWLFYLAVGGEPVRSVASAYLFDIPVVLGTFALPLLAIAGLGWTRRSPYGPFFGLLAAATLVVMAAGFPEGAPMRGLLSEIYYGFEPVRFLRTTYKAAPLLALSFALLGAVALRELIRREPVAVLAAAVVAVFAGWPLVTGRAIERDEAYEAVPAYWRAALADAQVSTPRDKRLMVLPGVVLGWYRWGYTVNTIAPVLSERPVLSREVVRYAGARASQLQAEVDDLLQQGRLVPGQLDPLLRLLGVGETLVSSDYRSPQSGSIDRASLAEVLSDQTGFSESIGDYGSWRTYVPALGRGGSERRLPDVQRFATPGAPGPGVVRVHPRTGATVIAGDAQGITALAAVGRLNPDRALFYAGDLGRGELATLVQNGATIVFSDSNRRRALEGNQLQANRGPTIGAGDALPSVWPSYTLFPDEGHSAQTVARYTGLRYLRAPLYRSFSVFPEHRPYAALDGRLDTSWLASQATFQPEKQRWIELAFARPRPLAGLRVYPHRDRLGLTDEIAVSVDGESERRFEVHPGWNRLEVGPRRARRVRLRVLGTDGFGNGPGGIAEIDVPGLRVRESLRLPTDLPRALGGIDLSRNPMLVVLERTTADFPARAGAGVGDPQAGSPLDMVDAEPGIERDVSLPVARRFELGGWASIDPEAPDQRIDELVGLAPGWRFSSSGRFEGLPANRASSAFDRDPRSAWVGDALPGSPPWIAWRGPRKVRIKSLRLLPGPAEIGSPRRVRVTWPHGHDLLVHVRADGRVRLPRAVRTRELRIFVLESRPPRSRRAAARALRATAVGEVVIPGLKTPSVPRSGPLAGGCSDIVVSAATGSARARLVGSTQALDTGRPLRIRGCGSPLALPAGTSRVHAPPGRVARIDHLLLSGAPPREPSAADAPARVLDPGDDAVGGRRDDVQVDLGGPAWLVLGESYSRGWRAWCSDDAGRERALGGPTPIDGFANGWQAGASCRRARFAFTPQRYADLSYAFSAAGLLTLLLLVALGPGARSPTRGWSVPASVRVHDPVRKLQPPAALALAVMAGAVGGLLFALRAGAVLGPLAFVLARVGVNVRRLLGLATAALAVVPLLYLIRPAPRLSGFTFSFPLHHLPAHWAAVLCVCCLAAAGVLAASDVRAALRRDGC